MANSIQSLDALPVLKSSRGMVFVKSNLLLRKLEIFSTAARVFADYKILQWKCDNMEDTPINDLRKETLWNEAHDRNAKFLFEKFTNLEALWIKLGQYLSSRADIMPEPYLKVLSQCQDALPHRPFSETVTTIESEFNKSVNEIFKTIDSTPLAVASIASVHRATLHDDTPVVVKVQHNNVAELLLNDLDCLNTIGETIRYLDPDFDLSPVVREWAKEVPKELDFKIEAMNMFRVQRGLTPFYEPTDNRLRIDVKLASTINHLVGTRVLVMSFVDGFKVDNKIQLDENKIDRDLIVQSITRSYAHQIFNEGFFNADPHPGNILIDRNDKRVVLLDFGLTKELSPEVRFNFAKMIVAADEGDIHNLLEAFASIGLKLRPDVPLDIALLVKYFFRDAKPSNEAKIENSKRRDEYKSKEEVKKKQLYIHDSVDVTRRNLLGWRTISRGEVLEIKGPNMIRVRLTNGIEIDMPRESVKLSKSKSPIDSWPDAFIFFERVLGLLRGLTASLDVSQSYLDVMTPYARFSLASPSLTSHVVGLDDNGHITDLLHSMVSNGDLLGCQVCVMKNGIVLIDLAAGVSDPYHRRPMCHDTKFCCFSVTKAVTATAIHMLCDDGLIELSAPISKYWPEFGQNGKKFITVADVLNHQSGLQHAGTEEFAMDPFIVCDTNAVMDLIEKASPERNSGYHYLSFGFILDGLVRRVTSSGLKEYIEERICSPLGLGEAFSIGHADHCKVPVATVVLNSKQVRAPKSSEEKSTTTTSRRPVDAPSLLMNPTFLANSPRIQQSSLPAANGYFNARSLAKYFNSLTTTSPLFKHDKGILYHLNNAKKQSFGYVSNEQMLQGNDGKFSGGFMLFPKDSCGTNNDNVFGHSGLGGSVALCDVSSGDTISIAITTNRLSFDAAPTRRIMRQIYKELELDPPIAFSKD